MSDNVICTSAGKYPECKKCPAAKIHAQKSFERCPSNYLIYFATKISGFLVRKDHRWLFKNVNGIILPAVLHNKTSHKKWDIKIHRNKKIIGFIHPDKSIHVIRFEHDI